ncbi:MAG: hypothetical protein HYW90_00955 [Candidatus Sungbacteria bacterium]|nr:hypothetical protein [Candidatus Sungbacteria bacterium]
MKKLTNSTKLLTRVSFFVVVLTVGWALTNLSYYFKKISHPFLVNDANADVPNLGYDIYFGSCPHVAIFNGKDFCIENDILPKNFAYDFSTAMSLYEGGEMASDILKLASIPQRLGHRLVLQLQEIEEEESFIDWLKLKRVLHHEASEALTDGVSPKIYVVDRDEAQSKILLPNEATHSRKGDISSYFKNRLHLWQKLPDNNTAFLSSAGEKIRFRFENLSKGAAAYLVVRSVFRNWMPGENKPIVAKTRWSTFSSLMRSVSVVQVLMFVGLIGIYFKQRELHSAFGFLPFIIGGGGGDGGGGGGGGGGCSVRFWYQDKYGMRKYFFTETPRDWNYYTTMTRIPDEAVQEDGSAVVEAEFTKPHKLGFLGILQEPQMLQYRSESLEVTGVRHSRFGDITEKLTTKKDANYAHLIPGDTATVEFSDPLLNNKEGEKETYFVESSGFFTTLRSSSKELAGNWVERLSEEGRHHYERLKSASSV